MSPPISRRDFLRSTGHACLLSACVPAASRAVGEPAPARGDAVRCINVVNFIREIEPRFTMDMMLPVRSQMDLILRHRLPASWLLQYDALVSGPFVPFLKQNMAPNHEVGLWFEMNEKHCKAAGVEWRGRPGYEWDHIPCVAFTIGYTPEERVKLADEAMRKFKEIWGKHPRSVASWNLDSLTMAHLTERYGVDAYAVCRDQVATDGFTIWGAPIAGYYPSKRNCWSPALDRRNQIGTPVFRMLGQDPVYYYNLEVRLPDGRRVREPDTMEPAWTAGRTPKFVEEFLAMISEAPTLRFAYAQLGQENTFPWPQQAEAYPKQMAALAELRDRGSVHVETMGETGRRFKKAFTATPAQAQVMLDDPFGNTDLPESSAWYQSRFYRADLHFRGDLPYLRDLTVYSDEVEQPFLTQATRLHDVEQRLPAALDGYHWSGAGAAPGMPGAGGFFMVEGAPVRLAGKPRVQEGRSSLTVEMPVTGGRTLTVAFEERRFTVKLTPQAGAPLALAFQWDPKRAPLPSVEGRQVVYGASGSTYSLTIPRGPLERTSDGWRVTAEKGGITVEAAQPV